MKVSIGPIISIILFLVFDCCSNLETGLKPVLFFHPLFQLLDRVKGFCTVQQEERDAVLAKQHDQKLKKMAAAKPVDSKLTYNLTLLI